jgi:hypothetical protein
MDPLLRGHCLDVMDRLYVRPIAQMFLSPVDPVSSHCPDYFILIARPMDLGTVRGSRS